MNSPTEQYLGAAFRDLVAEQPFTPDVSAIGHLALRDRRRMRIARAGTGVGVVALAAAAAVGVASVGPSAPAPAARASGAHPVRVGKPASAPRPTGSADAQAPLVTLAVHLAAEPQPTGDATLVERETRPPGQASVTVWDLYTDDGRYFFSQTRAGLPAQVREDNNQGGGMFGREVAAATYAATGNLDTAALKMAWLSEAPVPAWLSAQVPGFVAGTQIDNYVWEDCQDALIAGAGNPQVRAGVLRLLSILPGITVTHGTADGQPTLTLTAGQAELAFMNNPQADPKANPGSVYQEAITINADTGIPLGFVGGPSGQASASTIVTYVVTRVSLADIAAGQS
jgi:hypothetical protein